MYFTKPPGCCHLIGMVPGSRHVPSARAFVVHVAQRVPVEGHALRFQDLGRLCESLRTLDLYCEGLGEFLVPFVEEELASHNSTTEPVCMASMLLYLGRMGIGSCSLWNLYSRYALGGAHQTPRVLLKTLESFSSRGLRDLRLLNAAGDALAHAVDSLHPAEVARVADVYARSRFHHRALSDALMATAERVTPSLDACGAVKLLQAFLLAYGPRGSGPNLPTGPRIPHRHRRALYLTFNRCSTGINHLNATELLAITAAMRLLPVPPPATLTSSIQRLFAQVVEPPPDTELDPFVKRAQLQAPPRDGTPEQRPHHPERSRPQRLTAQQLAAISLAEARKRRQRITGADALAIAQLNGKCPLEGSSAPTGPPTLLSEANCQ
ncbi:cysteine desulfurase [Babesia caballi]|uniref:Cysteine desulfurase n=1 Tax=Babesia caballi TaxID=5871 RepID=A0AAV4M0P6_BABCB|nr:cysteine desulfurase [Babesia caballi]